MSWLSSFLNTLGTPGKVLNAVGQAVQPVIHEETAAAVEAAVHEAFLAFPTPPTEQELDDYLIAKLGLK